MQDFVNWRLLREQLTDKKLLDNELTDEPLDQATSDACVEFINQQDPDEIPEEWSDWDDQRVAILALQFIAKQADAYQGELDGLAGPSTKHALEVMEYRLANAGAIDKIPEEVSLKNPETFKTVMDAKARAKEPASIRYCNPGAMYPGPSATKFGSKRYEVIGGGHLIAVFDDDLHGAAAQFDLLYNKYTGLTIRAAITRWCGNNSAGAYTQRVSKETGLSPDAVLTKAMVTDPAIAISFCRAAAQVEAGKPYPLDDAGWLEAHQMFMEGNSLLRAPTQISPQGGASPLDDNDPGNPIPPPQPAPVRARDEAKAAIPPTVWPRQRDVPSFFGPVGQNQVRLPLPYPMKLAWQLSTVVTSMSVHAKVADSAGRIFKAVLDAYGIDEIKRLRLDLYGGSLNVRQITSGSGYSMHSWGIAIDMDPDHNGFKTSWANASFSGPEYKSFIDAWYAEGWINLGRERNYDPMHFQAARL